MGEQHQLAVQELGSKDKDRAVQEEKIARDFEAKLAKIGADMQIALLDSVNSRMDLIGAQVEKMEKLFESQNDESAILELARKAAQGISGPMGGNPLGAPMGGGAPQSWPSSTGTFQP
jgi:hypothetical protein